MFKNALLTATAIAAFTLPASAQDASFPGVFDRPYQGSVIFEVFPAEGGARLEREAGEGEAIFRREDDAIRLAVSASVEGRGELEISTLFDVEAEDGWRGFTPQGMDELTQEGRILSIGLADGHLNTIWGAADGQNLSLTLRRTPTGALRDTPEGEYEMVFTFDLAQAAQDVHEDEVQGPDSDCARIVTQTRMIANPGGGAMSMIMVPVCVPG